MTTTSTELYAWFYNWKLSHSRKHQFLTYLKLKVLVICLIRVLDSLVFTEEVPDESREMVTSV